MTCPDADVLVIDEGHALDDILSEHLGITISKQTSETILKDLHEMAGKRLLKAASPKPQNLFSSIDYVSSEMSLFWELVEKEKEQEQEQEQEDGAIIGDFFALKELLLCLAGSMKLLCRDIKSSLTSLFYVDEELELNATVSKLGTLARDMETFALAKRGCARWIEVDEHKTTLRMAPIYPEDFVRNNIVPDYSSVILTSATLAIDGDFSLTKKILGLDTCKTMTLPSPYDISTRVSVILKHHGNQEENSDAMKLGLTVLGEAERKDGGILVLFTSRQFMRKVWALTAGKLIEMGYSPMVQGNLPSHTMIDRMRERTNGIIFGLATFWEGVDIRGDSLKCVIITKLPFEVPTEPIARARAEAIRSSGGDPFFDYALPRAILKFRQGVGRLIRSKSDKGRLVICDDRVKTKGYGRRFLESLS